MILQTFLPAPAAVDINDLHLIMMETPDFRPFLKGGGSCWLSTRR